MALDDALWDALPDSLFAFSTESNYAEPRVGRYKYRAWDGG